MDLWVPILYVHILRRIHARLICSVSPPKWTLQKIHLLRRGTPLVFRLCGSPDKATAGVWVLPRQNAFGYPNAMLAKSVTRRERFLIRKLPPIPLISIAECEYYKRDFKPGSSFLRGTFLSLFQSKIVLILFCWKQQWFPYVGFLALSPTAFQSSLCRVPCAGSGGFPGFLM